MRGHTAKCLGWHELDLCLNQSHGFADTTEEEQEAASMGPPSRCHARVVRSLGRWSGGLKQTEVRPLSCHAMMSHVPARKLTRALIHEHVIAGGRVGGLRAAHRLRPSLCLPRDARPRLRPARGHGRRQPHRGG